MPTKPVTARLPADLDIAFQAVAWVTGKTVGALIREALEEYLVHNWTEEELSTALSAYFQRERDEQENITKTAVQVISQSREKIEAAKSSSSENADDA